MRSSKMLRQISRLIKRMFYSKWIEETFFRNGIKRSINGATIYFPLPVSRFYPPIYEPVKTDFVNMHCRKGSTAIDIGAHIGLFTVFMARCVGPNGKVYSFEPTPYTFEILRKTIRLNQLEEIVSMRQQMVSKTGGRTGFFISEQSIVSNANSISELNIRDGATRLIEVESISLDGLLGQENFADLSFIKIDAEGAELGIIQGSLKLIRKFRPHISIEVHPQSYKDSKDELSEIYDLVESLGYRVSDGMKQMDRNSFVMQDVAREVFMVPQ